MAQTTGHNFQLQVAGVDVLWPNIDLRRDVAMRNKRVLKSSHQNLNALDPQALPNGCVWLGDGLRQASLQVQSIEGVQSLQLKALYDKAGRFVEVQKATFVFFFFLQVDVRGALQLLSQLFLAFGGSALGFDGACSGFG
nr:hypothetical protein [Limnohabitans sp.]